MRLDRPQEALQVLDEAIAAAKLLPEGLHEAELHRLKGAALLRVNNKSEARAFFLEAARIAKEQRASLFEMRAKDDLR